MWFSLEFRALWDASEWFSTLVNYAKHSARRSNQSERKAEKNQHQGDDCRDRQDRIFCWCSHGFSKMPNDSAEWWRARKLSIKIDALSRHPLQRVVRSVFSSVLNQFLSSYSDVSRNLAQQDW